MNALITAFEPFGGEAVNPSAMLLERLPGTVGRFSVRKLLLPVAYDPADRLLRSAFDPSLDLILCLGQAAGREGRTFERDAVKLDDCAAPDNDGTVRLDTPIDPFAPAAFLTGLPVRAMADAAAKTGIPAKVSYSAGAYLCNHVYFRASQLAAQTPGCRAVFVHMCCIPGQNGSPCLPLEQLLAGVAAAIEVL